ncbi:MAG: hypothetical protein AB1704_22335 [Pseudomonadota bacterium]|uniref:hypothetical protein n=1 Tax=Burkholderiaceae TaxID=119060 RepID=UPI0010F9CA29|nr:hypothetical protein [Burkholderia sp. 4M9327F10]
MPRFSDDFVPGRFRVRRAVALACLAVSCLPVFATQDAGGQAAAQHAPRTSARTPGTSAGLRLPARPDWGVQRYRLSTSGASVADVLRDLSSATGVPIAAGPHVAGSVEGRFDLAPQRFLEVLTNAYGLLWYYDGTVLHVDSTSDARSLTLRLNYAKPAALHTLLDGTGSTDPRFPLADDTPAPGLITVRGPPAYLALVEKFARQVDGAARAKVATSVRIVGLRYGTAADRVAQTNDRTSPVEGVASEARRLLDPPDNRQVDVVEYEAPLPVIAADARTNAVLIRDRPQRLDADAQVVAVLDSNAPLVKLDVLIADVQSAALPQLPLGNARAGPSGGAGGQVRVDADGEALRGQLRQMETSHTAHICTENELATIDHVAAALEQRLDRPVAVSGRATPADTAPAAMSLRVVPSVDSRASPPGITLAVELRSAADIEVARMTLAPHQGIVLVVPDESGAQGSTRSGTTWLVMLVPHVIDSR